jgi:hypothetical protein
MNLIEENRDGEAAAMNKLEKFLYRFKFYRRFKAWLARQEDKPCDCGVDSYEIDANLVIEQKIRRLEKLKSDPNFDKAIINQRIEQVKNSRII